MVPARRPHDIPDGIYDYDLSGLVLQVASGARFWNKRGISSLWFSDQWSAALEKIKSQLPAVRPDLPVQNEVRHGREALLL